MKKVFRIILCISLSLAVLLSAFSLLGCGGSYSENADYYDYPANKGAFESSSEDVTAYSGERIIIYSAYLHVTVDNCTKSADEMKNKVAADYPLGYLEYESANDDVVYLHFRVPQEKLTEFIEYVKSLGKVTKSEIDADDVTEEHANATNKINALQLWYNELNDMLEKAKEANDFNAMLNISKELKSVAADLDWYQHLADSYTGRSELSFVSVTLNKEEVDESPNVWGNIGKTLTDSFESVGVVFGYIVTVLVALLPYALIGFGVVCVVFAIIGIVRRSKGKSFFPRKKGDKKAEKNKKPPENANNS